MGEFNEALKAHLTNQTTRHEATLEINGQEFEVYATPLTGADLDSICRKHKSFVTNPTIEAIVDLLIKKTRSSASGGPAFDLKDKPLLLRMPLDWIHDAREKLLPDGDAEISDETVEEAEKNS